MIYRISFAVIMFLGVVMPVSAGLPTEAPLNPVLPGADPHAVVLGSKVWLYPTHYASPVHQFYAYSSEDLQHWEKHGPVSEFEKVKWIYDDGVKNTERGHLAVAEKDGKYYFYYSVGSQNPTPSRIGVAVGITGRILWIQENRC